MTDFDKTKREPLLIEDPYRNSIAFKERSLVDPEVESMLSDPDHAHDHKVRLSWSRVFKALELLIQRYSGGDPLDDLRPFAERAMHQFQRHFEAFPDPDERLKLWESDAYQYVMWLLSLGILLDLKEYAPQIATWVSANEDDGQDVLVHRLFERFGVSMPGETLIHEKPYASLLEATEATGAEQQKAMIKYLKTWYSGMKNCYWYDRHKRRVDAGFFGYWAFEAGLVTLAWDIDDSAYRDMPFYPKDMVDFARQQRERPPSESKRPHISGRTGETCPYAGKWSVQESPDAFLQERMFKAGEPFPPGIGRDGKEGSVTWIVLTREDGGPTRVD
jgi:hypothetical protein